MARKLRRRAEGTGSVFEKRPGVWAIRWRHDGRRFCKVGYRSRAEAEAVMAAVAADMKTDRLGLGPDPDSLPPFGVFFSEWLEQRKLTHRTWDDDQGRWKNHFAKAFGDCDQHQAFADRQAHTITTSDLEVFVVAKLKSGMNPATVGHCLRLLSRVYGYLVRHSQRTGVKANPVRSLDKSVRRLYKPTHESKTVPFIEKLNDIQRIIEALTAPYSVMYAVGAYAGPRPGELKALHWEDIDLDRRRIKVWRQVARGSLGPLKDDEARVVPVLDPLLPILKSWRQQTGGKGFAFASVVVKRGGRHKSEVPLVTNGHTLLDHLDQALADLKMKRITWYQATRHTFASQWVLNGGSIEKLATILGHSSTWVTERYAHLKPDLFMDAELGRLNGGSSGHKNSASGHHVATGKPVSARRKADIISAKQ